MQEQEDGAGRPRDFYPSPATPERGSAGRKGEDIEAFEREAAELHPEHYFRFENLLLYRDFVTGEPPASVAARIREAQCADDPEPMLRQLGPFWLELSSRGPGGDAFFRAGRGPAGAFAALRRGALRLSVGRTATSGEPKRILDAVETFRQAAAADSLPAREPATLAAYWYVIRKYLLAPLCIILLELKDVFDAIVKGKLFRSGSGGMAQRRNAARALDEIRYHHHLLARSSRRLAVHVKMWFRTGSWPISAERAYEEIESAVVRMRFVAIPDAIRTYTAALNLPLTPEESLMQPQEDDHEKDADAEVAAFRFYACLSRYRSPFTEDALAHQDSGWFESPDAFVRPELNILTENSDPGTGFGVFAEAFEAGLAYAEQFPRGTLAWRTADMLVRRFIIRPAAVSLHEAADVWRAHRALEDAAAEGRAPSRGTRMLDPRFIALAAREVKDRIESMRLSLAHLQEAIILNFPAHDYYQILRSEDGPGAAKYAVMDYADRVMDMVLGSDFLVQQ